MAQKNVGTFKWVSNLALICNAAWGILFSILLIACILNSEAIVNSTLESINPDGFIGSLIVFYLILSVVIVLLSWLCFSGIRKMRKHERKGFYLYSIANGLWVLLLMFVGEPMFIVAGLISIAFIFYFALQLPKFN